MYHNFSSILAVLVSQLQGREGEADVWAWIAQRIWFLWKRRNKWVFEGALHSIEDILTLTQQRFNEWCNSQEYHSHPEPKLNPIVCRVFSLLIYSL
ncbi:hypothetical protein Syun_001797 [Stephania yunnanensis]|uniref:Uncharacterized protein n=1 Tax=Stephania yunnanensis TaxID=152371 RepID=A0AAP0Q6M6_9MAGN